MLSQAGRSQIEKEGFWRQVEGVIMMMMWFYVTLPIFTGLGRCPIVSWDLLEQ